MEDQRDLTRMKLMNFDEGKRLEWENKRLPYSALIELTAKCNMNCVHCYLQKSHNEIEMSYDKVIEILNILYDRGILFLTFTGGEIFTRKDFLEIYLYAKKKGFMIELFTNGSLLTEEMLMTFKKYPPVLIDISLYGANEDTYQMITGCKGQFERVINNCKKLVDADIRVALRTPVLKPTLNQISEMKEIADKLGVVFSTSFEISSTIDGDFISQQYQVATRDVLLYEVNEFFEKNARVDMPPENAIKKGAPFPVFSCKMGKAALVIDYAGNMFPCMKFRHMKEPLTKDNFGAIWKSYEKYNHLVTSSTNKCNDCDARYYCEVCPAEMDFLFGDYEHRTIEACKIGKFRKQLYENELSKEMATDILDHWQS